MRQITSRAKREHSARVETNGDPWYPDAEATLSAPDLSDPPPGRLRSHLRCVIADTMRKWKWVSPCNDEHPGGISWLEIYVALLLNDTILELLHNDMGGRGWPGKYSANAEPERIFRHLRTAVRSAQLKSQHGALQDMGTKIARLKAWGFFRGYHAYGECRAGTLDFR